MNGRSLIFAVVAVVLAGGAMGGPLFAQSTADPPAPAAPGSGGSSQALVCVNAGTKYQPGEFACIAACHQQRRLARCDVGSTAANWTYVSDACPSAMINAPWPSDHTELPAVAAMSPIPVNVNRTEPTPDVSLAFATFAGPRLAQ